MTRASTIAIAAAASLLLGCAPAPREPALVGPSSITSGAMLSNLTWRARRAQRAVDAALAAHDRYVDMGARLCVAVRDEVNGRPYLPGKPKLRVLRTHEFGGVVDTRAGEFVGPSERPVTWFCSEAAEPLILHGDALPSRLCVEGAMGSGKSTALTLWSALRVLESTGMGVEGGVTAPTFKRFGEVKKAFVDLLPRSWVRWRERDHMFAFANGVTLRLVATHVQSEREGSPIQGFGWAFVGSDEIQDSLHVDGDIEARGRDAPDGVFRRFSTATVKDHPDYREWRDRIRSTRQWGLYSMSGLDSPFVDPSYWQQLRETMTEREYERKVLALDLRSDRAVYPEWARELNVRPIPALGARDITRQVLAQWGQNLGVLVGHDPGERQDVSLVLKAYQLPGEADPVWFVVDELTTPESTSHQHAQALMKLLRDRWGCYPRDMRGQLVAGGDAALVRADPYGAAQTKPDRATYTVFRDIGLTILPAAYGKGTNPGQVPRVEGIEMVRTLLCDATGRRRLFVACDDRRVPAARKLVEAFEKSERDALGRAERERKDEKDLSHWPSALRYALWGVERPRQRAARERTS